MLALEAFDVALQGAVVLDLTLLKQDAPDRALYDEAA